MIPTRLSRRSILRLGGTSLVGSFAGCSAPNIGQESGIVIGDILIRHYSEKPHTVQIELERDGDSVAKKMYDNLRKEQKKIIKATWPSSPADYRLYTVIEGPLANANEPFDLFVNKFTEDDIPTDGNKCSVIDIQIEPPSNPGQVVIGLRSPGPSGFGNCKAP